MEVTSTYENATFEEVLDDLCVRFIFNLPEEEMTSRERVCFQIEEAHWFYEDFVREQNPKFHGLNLRQFVGEIFKHCSLLQKWGMSEDAYTEFMTYKKRVPIRGAILLNEALTHCVLVKGWKQSASWSFPRGKINKDEEDDLCAVREVLEETGYNISKLIDPTQFILHENLGNNHMKLYIVPGVPEDTVFVPISRKEISRIEWVELEELPLFSKKKPANIGTFSMGKLFMVTPFMPALRKWIHRQHKQQHTKTKSQGQVRHLNADGETEPETSAVEFSPPRGTTSPVLDVQSASNNVNLLKNMLGVQTASMPEPLHQPLTLNKEDAAMKLMNMLKAGAPQSQPQPQHTSPPVTNVSTGSASDLLAILRGGPASQQPSSGDFNPSQPAKHSPNSPRVVLQEQTPISKAGNNVYHQMGHKQIATKSQAPPLQTVVQNQLNKSRHTATNDRHAAKASVPQMTILKRPSSSEPEQTLSQFMPQPHNPLSQSAKLLEILKTPTIHSVVAHVASKTQGVELATQPKLVVNEREAPLVSNTFQPPLSGPTLHQAKQTLDSFHKGSQNDISGARTPGFPAGGQLNKFSRPGPTQVPQASNTSYQKAAAPLLPKENAGPAVQPKEKQEHLASLLQTLKSTKAIVPNPTSLSLNPELLVAQYQVKSPELEQNSVLGAGPSKVSVPSSLGVEKPSPIIVSPPKILTPSLSPTFDRRQVVKNEDAQQLLGLFRQVKAAKEVLPAPYTVTPPAPKIIPAPNTVQIMSPQTMLPSPIVQGPSARKRSLLSPDKNELLLGYLDQIAKQYGH